MTKRITIFVDPNIDVIRDHLDKTLGVKLTYVQLFDYLINYYKTNSTLPKTIWRKD